MKSLGVLAAGAIFAQPASKGSKFEVASVVATVTGAYASAYMARQSPDSTAQLFNNRSLESSLAAPNW